MCFHHTLYSDGESGESMRNFFFLRSFYHGAEGLFQNPEKTIDHLGLVPEKTLEALYPFKVGNDYTAGVAKYIRDYENFVPTFDQYFVGFDSGRSIGALGQDSAANFPGVLFVDDSADGGRHQNVPRQRQQTVGQESGVTGVIRTKMPDCNKLRS
jgi:hypothetical protein